MPRSPLRNEPPLLDADRAIRLVEDATALRRSFPELDDIRLEMVLSKLPFDAALFALETAADTGDPRVLAAALDLTIARRDPTRIEYELASIAQVILPNITEVDNRVRDCARSKSSELRAYTAMGLGERALRSMRGEGDEVDAEAASIVFALTKDEDNFVRKCAREALGGAAPPAWAPFFARDPLATRPAAEAAGLRGPLDRAAEALEKGVHKDATPLAEAIAELPDELAGPILDAWMRATGGWSKRGAEPLVDRWLALDEERLVAWARETDFMDIHAAQRSIAPALRRRGDVDGCMRLAQLCLELGADDDETSRMASLADLLAHAWPEEADPTALLELGLGAPLAEAGALAWDEDSHSYARAKLREIALAPRAGLEALLEPLAGALVAGFPGRWEKDAKTIRERLIELAHPALRAHAEAWLRGDDEDAIAWALRHLVRGGHEPDRDPPPEALLRDAARDARLRAVMLTEPELRSAAQELLRIRLVELGAGERIDLAASLIDAGEALAPEEWAAVRAARGAIEEPAEALFALPPPEAWTEEDGAFVRGLIDAALTGPSDPGAFVGRLVTALTARPRHEPLLAILETERARLPERLAMVLEGTLSLVRMGGSGLRHSASRRRKK